MESGTLQSQCIKLSAIRAWEEFSRLTGKTKEKLKKEGYRVKQIKVYPAFET